MGFLIIQKLKVLDLFSGIGGFSLAANRAGFETIGFVESDPFCNAVLRKHWPHVVNYGDIKALNFYQHVDLITGGFPCQPFSIAGKKKGKDDNRYLWPEFFRIVKQSKPNWIVAENVTGIVSLALDDIIIDLEREDYEARAFILPACAANAPHRRDRIWIIANRHGERCNVRRSHRKERYLQEDEKRNIEAIQSEWEKLKPKSWATHSASNWFDFNANASRRNDGIPDRVDRIKALGNAIVPQVVFPILAAIYAIEARKN